MVLEIVLGGEGENLKIRIAQRFLGSSLFCLLVCLLVCMFIKNHHTAEGSVHDAHEDHHIGRQCPSDSGWCDLPYRSTDANQSMHCIPSCSSLFALIQGEKKAEAQGEG